MIKITIFQNISRGDAVKQDPISELYLPRFLSEYPQIKVKPTKSMTKKQAVFLSQKMLELAYRIQLNSSDELVRKHQNKSRLLEKRARVLSVCAYTLSQYASMINSSDDIQIKVTID